MCFFFTVYITHLLCLAMHSKNVGPFCEFLPFQTEEQALEVQSGLSLFGQALGAVRESVSRAAVQSLIDNNKSNIHSLGQVLRSLHIKDLSLSPVPAGSDSATRKVSSLSELFRVHTNFLRGKVRLLLTNAPACQQNST
eukprot:XP_014052034.1 PREDICTED: erythropoietin-like isoform X3 [Salmo salar]